MHKCRVFKSGGDPGYPWWTWCYKCRFNRSHGTHEEALLNACWHRLYGCDDSDFMGN